MHLKWDLSFADVFSFFEVILMRDIVNWILRIKKKIFELLEGEREFFSTTGKRPSSLNIMSLHFCNPLTLSLNLLSAQHPLYFLLDEVLLSMHNELIV